MATRSAKKAYWTDKFHSPTVEQLRSGYARPAGQVFDAARALLGGTGGICETVAWHGVPWRWTLVYQDPAGERPLAYLIPDPSRLQVCVPLTRPVLEAMPLRRFKKGIRDGILFARTVGGTMWPTWELPTRAAVEDVGDVIRRKHRLVTAPTGGLAVGA